MRFAVIRRAFLLLLLCALLVGCEAPNAPTEPTEPATEPTEPPIVAGWQEQDGRLYYLCPDGTFATGWQEIDGKPYYLGQTGVMETGWLEQDGKWYYLLPEGGLAIGKVNIGGEDCFFTKDGVRFLLVNPWNPISQDYAPELVELEPDLGYAGLQVNQACRDALTSMVRDCNAQSGSTVFIVSAYRSLQIQTYKFNNLLSAYLYAGYSLEDAYALTAREIAVPGTSEHHTGLAADIMDTRYPKLDEVQATVPGQIWLMENCWRYGFILRYPADKTEITGIIYEPWHYRYVGVELATELYESGLTLEEYFDELTMDNG